MLVWGILEEMISTIKYSKDLPRGAIYFINTKYLKIVPEKFGWKRKVREILCPKKAI